MTLDFLKENSIEKFYGMSLNCDAGERLTDTKMRDNFSCLLGRFLICIRHLCVARGPAAAEAAPPGLVLFRVLSIGRLISAVIEIRTGPEKATETHDPLKDVVHL